MDRYVCGLVSCILLGFQRLIVPLTSAHVPSAFRAVTFLDNRRPSLVPYSTQHNALKRFRYCGRNYAEFPTNQVLFRDERAMPAILELPEGTRVGRASGLAFLGAEVDEDSLGEIKLWQRRGGGRRGHGWHTEGEEGGPGPP